jgi:hypothetical protein
MKKTTIYIDENDFEMLKTKAFLNNCSISEMIRRGIKKICLENDPALKQAMKSLSKIRENFEEYSEKEIMDMVNEEIKFVRESKKNCN